MSKFSMVEIQQDELNDLYKFERMWLTLKGELMTDTEHYETLYWHGLVEDIEEEYNA